MPRKGKKKHRAQEASEASTSATGATASTSEKQQESSELHNPSQKKQQSQQQQSQQQLQQQQPAQVPQPSAWGPRPRQSVPQVSQQQSAQGPRPQQSVPQVLPQQSVRGPRPQPPTSSQVSQQPAWGPRPQPPTSSQVSQQPAWGPRPPLPTSSQVSQQPAWGPRPQPPTSSQVFQQPTAGPRPQPPTSSQVLQQPAAGPRPQPPTSSQVLQQPAAGPRPQPPISSQVLQQPAAGPRPQQTVRQQVPQLSAGDARQQQYVQQIPQPQPTAWGPRPQLVPQQRAQAKTSYPSTLSEQDSGAGSSQYSGTSKMDTSSISEISSSMSQIAVSRSKFKPKLSEKDLNIPRRPNKCAGSRGQPIHVLTNMFQILFEENFSYRAVHYDVKVIPTDIPERDDSKKSDKTQRDKVNRELKNKTLLREIFEIFRRKYFPNRYPAYDGMANAFTAKDLSESPTLCKDIDYYDREKEQHRTFSISLSKAGDIDLSWIKNLRPGIDENSINQLSIQVLDVILRHAPASRLISVGRSLFSPGENKRVTALTNGLDLHVGGFMSAVIGWKPYLNVDVCHKAFATPQSIIDVMCELCRVPKDRLNELIIDRNKDTISKFLTGLKVNYQIPGQPSTKRTHRVNGLGPNSDDHTFDVKGKMYTTKEYFAKCKNYNLRFSIYPCLWVGKRDGKTYLPVELCNIAPGQAINKKLNEFQTTKMIREAATNTSIRRKKILEAYGTIDVNNSDVMKYEFPIKVTKDLKEIDARILNPPELQYKGRNTTTVRKGVWRAGYFNKAAILEDNTWTVIDIACNITYGEFDTFVGELQKQATRLGMKIGNPVTPFINLQSTIPHVIEKTLIDKKNLKLIIIILPNRTDIVYGKIKNISELKVGVLTQCIKRDNAINTNQSTLQNILLKINSKLNGVNHTFASNTVPSCLREKKYMLIGADVSHPSPDAKDIPSVAAVAASHDETSFKYNVTIRLQQPKQEEIADLKEIMLKHILFYVREMKTEPSRIIFYRDGVSEGQIAMVLDKEIRCIREACMEYARSKPGFKPEITFIIVQKRHHVRIFPIRAEDSEDRNFNVKAGTIVDTEITHPNHIDFYLVSHASIQGTARPTKYRCICNESNFNEDQLEELTYYLCHMYARCTRSVSYPAPTYYAHLAAYRGRMWIQGRRYTEVDFQDKNRCRLESKLHFPMSFI